MLLKDKMEQTSQSLALDNRSSAQFVSLNLCETLSSYLDLSICFSQNLAKLGEELRWGGKQALDC